MTTHHKKRKKDENNNNQCKHSTLMSKLQSKRLMRTMKAPVKLSLGGGSMGSHAFSGRAPIRKPYRDDTRHDTVRKT